MPAAAGCWLNLFLVPEKMAIAISKGRPTKRTLLLFYLFVLICKRHCARLNINVTFDVLHQGWLKGTVHPNMRGQAAKGPGWN